MAPTSTYTNKLEQLKKGLSSFEKAMAINTNLFRTDEVISDTIKNGQIQKFEFCCEMLWKCLKLFIEEKNGIIANSPKTVFKEFFKCNYIDEDTCEKLIEMINDRNSLSHIYNEDYFLKVYQHLANHLKIIKLTTEKINFNAAL